MSGTENGFRRVENGTKLEFSCKKGRFRVELVPNGVFHAVGGGCFSGESSLVHIGRPPRRSIWQRGRVDGRSGNVAASAEHQLLDCLSTEDLATWPRRRSANSSTASGASDNMAASRGAPGGAAASKQHLVARLPLLGSTWQRGCSGGSSWLLPYRGAWRGVLNSSLMRQGDGL